MNACKWNNISRTFFSFFQLLHMFIENCWEQQADTTKVVFDNTRIHLTDKVKRWWNYLKLEINTLPACTPQLAQVETVFDIIKRRTSRQRSCKTINFGKTSERREVMDTLKLLSIDILIKIWEKFVSIAKKWIVDAYEV